VSVGSSGAGREGGGTSQPQTDWTVSWTVWKIRPVLAVRNFHGNVTAQHDAEGLVLR
jgi:hypothetical protein